MTAALPGALPPALGPEEAAALAARHGLTRLGGRPPFGAYVADLWKRRSFIWTLATSESAARTTQDRLGVLWTVLNPLLLIVSYYLIFGLLLDTDRGVSNFVGFLSAGVIAFGYSASAITKGSKAIVGNLSLVRTLRFPRAVLPVSVTLTEFVSVLPALAVLAIVMLLTGEPLRWTWLLLPVALVIQTKILAGMVFMGARLLNVSRDLGNLIPVAIRLMRYVSGVFFSIEAYTEGHPVLENIMSLQPFALPITLMRQVFLEEVPLVLGDWLAGAAWAVGLVVVGLWVFWRDEAKYGRA